MSLFRSKIKCLHCNKNMKSKLERGKRKYLCSTYDLGKGCVRNIIKEDYLIDLLSRRFKNEEIENIVQRVKVIEVEDKKEIIVHFEDDEPMVVSYKDKIYKY